MEKNDYVISGSVIGAILGLSRWVTRDEIWERLYKRQSIPPNEAMERGIIVEPYLFDVFSKKYFQVTKNGKSYQKPSGIDGVIFSGEPDGFNDRAIVEFKTTSSGLPSDPPRDYYAQVQWYMWIMNYSEAYLYTVKIPTIDPLKLGLLLLKVPVADIIEDECCFKIQRNQEFIDEMVMTAKAFGESLVKGVPPLDISVDMETLYWRERGSIEISKDVMSLLEEYEGIQNQIKQLETKKDRLRERILTYTVGADIVTFEGRPVLKWTRERRSLFDTKLFKLRYPDLYKEFTKEIETRVFRILKGKKDE